MKRIFFLAAGAALSASLAAIVLATSGLAQSAREIRGPSPYLAIQNEPAPKHQGERTMTTASETPKARTVDMKFEIVVVPVSDIDRAKGFYGGLGWRLDAKPDRQISRIRLSDKTSRFRVQRHLQLLDIYWS